MTEEPDVVIDYPVFRWLAFVLLLMGAIWLTGLQMSEARGERNMYLFALGMTALGVVFCWWFSLRTEFHRNGLVIARGIRPVRHVLSVSYEDVGRVRTGNLDYRNVSSVVVTVKAGRWRNIQIGVATFYPPRMAYMRVRGEGSLPEVVAKESEFPDSRKLRRIAKLVEERAAAAGLG